MTQKIFLSFSSILTTTRAPLPHRYSPGAVAVRDTTSALPMCYRAVVAARTRAPLSLLTTRAPLLYWCGGSARHYQCSPYALPRGSGRARARPPFVADNSRTATAPLLSRCGCSARHYQCLSYKSLHRGFCSVSVSLFSTSNFSAPYYCL